MRPLYLDRFSDAEIDDARAYARDAEVDGYGDIDDPEEVDPDDGGALRSPRAD